MSKKTDDQAFLDGILVAHGTAIACQLVLKALLIQFVMKEENPRGALSAMFNGISSDLDKGGDAMGPSVVLARARKIVEDTFSSFDQALARRELKSKGNPD
jgi:hypothetical protein